MNAALWIVLKGSISTEDGLMKHENFSIIGDLEESEEVASSQQYVALTDSDIAFVTYEDINSVLGKDIKNTLLINSITESLVNVKILRSLPVHELQVVASRMALRHFAANEVIIEEGEEGNEFFIIKSGTVNVIREGLVIRTLEESGFFGERAILLNEKRTATVITNTVTSCWVLNREDFLTFADEDLLQFLHGRMLLQDDTVSLENLLFVKKVGEGSFGSVVLVANSVNKALYCLKTVPKRKIIDNKLYSSIVMERKILLQIDHPFIMKLVKTFKDDLKVYFLTEFVNGMEMFEVLDLIKKFNEEQAKFYTACIVLMLEHLHERNILYRDLKPENLMLDIDGYPKLIDFGVSKILEGKTATIIGTPHYMAPEIICGNSYGLAIDYWSLGILLYEFFTGVVPFGNSLDNPFMVYEAILKRNLSFPQRIQNLTHATALIKQLLSTKPVLRGSITNIMNHPWLAYFNWGNLRLRKVKTPYIPPVQSIKDEVEKALIVRKPMVDELAQSQVSHSSVPPKHENWDAEF